MDLSEIDRQMNIYKTNISACTSSIMTLWESIPVLDDSKINFQNPIDSFDYGYKCEAGKISKTQVEGCKSGSVLQVDSVKINIKCLETNINYFKQELKRLEAEKAAELSRLHSIATQQAATAAAAKQKASKY